MLIRGLMGFKCSIFVQYNKKVNGDLPFYRVKVSCSATKNWMAIYCDKVSCRTTRKTMGIQRLKISCNTTCTIRNWNGNYRVKFSCIVQQESQRAFTAWKFLVVRETQWGLTVLRMSYNTTRNFRGIYSILLYL